MAKYGLDFGTTKTAIYDLTGKSLLPVDIMDSPALPQMKSLKRELFKGTRTNAALTDAIEEKIIEFFKGISATAKKNGYDLSELGSVRLGAPAIWDGEARKKLVHLADKAGIGLDDLTIVEEATAAGVAWAEKNKLQDGVHQALVFDMGGGTLDVALLELGVSKGSVSISILSCVGNSFAGDWFDQELARTIAKRENPKIQAHQLAEKQDQLLAGYNFQLGKENVSSSSKTETLPAFDQSLPKIQVSPQDLEVASEVMLHEAYRTIDFALRRGLLVKSVREVDPHESVADRIRTSKLKTFKDLAKNVNFVILVGGMQEMPSVRSTLVALLPEAKFYRGTSLLSNPSEGKGQKDLATRTIVASGLSAGAPLESMTYDRWPFDVVLETQVGSKKSSELLIGAYEDIIDPEMILTEASHLHKVARPTIPIEGNTSIVVRSLNGKAVPLKSTNLGGGEVYGPIPISSGPYTEYRVNQYYPRVIFYLQGVIRIFDGNGSGSAGAKGDSGELWWFKEFWKSGKAPQLAPENPGDNPPQSER